MPDIFEEISGREIEILHALGIYPLEGNHHIRCPYPHHEDQHPSWRWISEIRKAVCTCSRPHSIIDVIIKMGRSANFAEAARWTRHTLGIR